MSDALELLLFPAAAAVVFVGMHTWLGLQVLRRGVIFADLALAQLSALGATVAVAAGHAPASTAGLSYALAFAMAGATLLTLLRSHGARISQEAVIGIVYVVATALTVLVVDRSPQGAEHVKKMLVGSILTIGASDVVGLAVLYGAIGLIHFIFRRPLLAAAEQDSGTHDLILWDLLFYGSFGVVVTSSVSLAGVLLVFSFLIIPAVIGNLYTNSLPVALLVGWGAGIAASFAGFGASLALDFPTGAVLVACFGVALLLAVAARWLLAVRAALLPVAAIFCLAMAAQGVWLLAMPVADQPVVRLLEAGGLLEPQQFLTTVERRLFAEAAENERRYREGVEQLRDIERDARWRGAGLSDDEIHKLSAFQRSYNEMGQGERFVQNHLRKLSRTRGRWWVAVPILVISVLGLLLIVLLRKSDDRAPERKST